MRLRETRLLKNLTQQALADMIDCTLSAYSNYERGEREPSIAILKKLSQSLNVSIDYLVGNDTEGISDPQLSDYEVQLIYASRKADTRAKADALRTLEEHQLSAK